MKYCIRTQTRRSRKRVRAHALSTILVAGFWLTPVVAQSPILSNDFEREPLGPIGTGGPEVGQPTHYNLPTIQADVIESGFQNQALEVLKSEEYAVARHVQWQFIENLEITAGVLEIDVTITPRTEGDFSFTLRGDSAAGPFYLQFGFDPGGWLSLSVPNMPGLDRSYTIDESYRFQISCDLDERYCSIVVDGTAWVTNARFSSVIESPAIIGFMTSFPGNSASGSRFEIDNLMVTAEQADQTPAEIAFSQQPGTAVAGGVVEPAIEVSVLNGAGLPIADPVDVTLSIHSGPVDAGLEGTLSAGTMDGVAVFDDVVFSEWGGYVLRAELPGTEVTGTSDFINVVRDRIFHSRMEYVAPPN